MGYNSPTKSNILDCLENYRGNINAELDEVLRCITPDRLCYPD